MPGQQASLILELRKRASSLGLPINGIQQIKRISPSIADRLDFVISGLKNPFGFAAGSNAAGRTMDNLSKWHSESEYEDGGLYIFSWWWRLLDNDDNGLV